MSRHMIVNQNIYVNYTELFKGKANTIIRKQLNCKMKN